MRIGGKEIKYTVTAGTMVLKEETADREKEGEGEKPRAQVFFIAYTKDSNGAKSTGKTPALRNVRLRFRSMVDRVHHLSGCIWESWGRAGWC